MKNFLKEFDTEIIEASHNAQVINITETEAHLIDPSIRDDLMQYPEETISQLEVYLDRTWRFPGKIGLIEIVQKVHIHQIRRDHLYRYISVPCVVAKVYDVQPGVVMASWQCSRCGCDHSRPNNFENQLLLDEPRECPHCNRKGNQTRFKFRAETSSYVDIQLFEVQEPPEGMRGRHQPTRLECLVRPHLVGQVFPGDKLIINGILKSVLRGNGKKHSIMDRRIHVYAIEKSKAEMDEDLTAEDIDQIRRLAKDERILWKLARSVAPHIYGLQFVKVALLLQQFGGVPREADDTPQERGDIHILLLGDPSTAKSKLALSLAAINPRAIVADGGSSSAVGLTAAVVKNKEDVFSIEAGALVMADGGFVFIDELDKLGEYDSAKLNEAMESQTISLHKAGAHVELNSRCSVLAAANPKGDRFDRFIPLFPQIAVVNSTTLSRFDVILFLKDFAEQDEEAEVARSMFSEARNGGQVEYDRDVEVSMIRKYVAYARENVHPTLPEDAEDILFEAFMKYREEYLAHGIDETGVAVDRRKIRALVRFSQAAARARLATEVSVDDAKLACEIIFDWSLGAVKNHASGGQMDLKFGTCQGQLDHVSLPGQDNFSELKEAFKIAEELSKTDPKGALPKNKLIGKILEDHRFHGKNIEGILKNLLQKGWMFEVKKEVYKIPTY